MLINIFSFSVLFIFPYFMEPQVLHNLSDFVMLDYQIDYDNHPLYSSGKEMNIVQERITEISILLVNS